MSKALKARLDRLEAQRSTMTDLEAADPDQNGGDMPPDLLQQVIVAEITAHVCVLNLYPPNSAHQSGAGEKPGPVPLGAIAMCETLRSKLGLSGQQWSQRVEAIANQARASCVLGGQQGRQGLLDEVLAIIEPRAKALGQ
jgi:hypothetical protein